MTKDMKYIDLVAYPIMITSVYVLIGLMNWSADPGTWGFNHRAIWVTWGIAWGWALQCRIKGKLL